MAALEGSNKATIETWLGKIQAGTDIGEEQDLVERLTRLILPELVALEVLLADRASMTRSATKVASDDVRTDHSINIQTTNAGASPMDGLIAALVGSIRGSDTINLTPDQEALVARAETGEVVAGNVDLVVNSPRRG